MPNNDDREPSLVEAIGRVVDAGQRVIVDRFDLARVDVGQVATRTLRSAVWLVLGAAVLAMAWAALTGALILVLRDHVSLRASLALVGGGNAAAGAVMIGLGARRASGGLENRGLLRDVAASFAGPAREKQP